MTNLYLCEYWNPKELVTPPDPRLVIVPWGNGHAQVVYDDSIKVDPDSLLPKKQEVHAWKFGITTQGSAKKRNRHYIDTLIWEEFIEHEQARLVEKILIYLNAPFFNPNKTPGVHCGEWIPFTVPAEMAIEFVNTEVQYARLHSMDELKERMNHCRDFYFDGDPNFGYFNPGWNPQRTHPITGKPKYADLLDRREDYISRVSQWWNARAKPAVEPMW